MEPLVAHLVTMTSGASCRMGLRARLRLCSSAGGGTGASASAAAQHTRRHFEPWHHAIGQQLYLSLCATR